MGKPQKHAELIKAWADGAEIQFKHGNKWLNITSISPYWEDNVEYRIKPEKKKYRILEFKDIYGKPYPSLVNTDVGAALVSNQSEFVRWVTDWIEYE